MDELLRFIIVSLIFFGVIRMGTTGSKYLMRQTARRWRYVMHSDKFPVYTSTLQQNFHYYNLLTPDEQSEFVDRLHYIALNKTFVPRGDLLITDEIRILISASLTQLTFGLQEGYHLPELRSIHITPESFYSALVGAQVKGLTFQKSGRVLLSWYDFKEGYRIPNDKINLGLHELGHALWLNTFSVRQIEAYYDNWHVVAMRELQSMRTGTDSEFLRDYAATNIEEFWACCIESFFEAPVQFRHHIPDLYQMMCTILNQDMAQKLDKLHVPA